MQAKLNLHRQLEIRMMPYDSSKIEFHDKMDMFIKMGVIKDPKLQVEEKRVPKKPQVPEEEDDWAKKMKRIQYLQRLQGDGV